jgi:hypothetical protein
MDHAGSVDGNSLWHYDVPQAYASNDLVQFYFHGWDDWDGPPQMACTSSPNEEWQLTCKRRGSTVLRGRDAKPCKCQLTTVFSCRLKCNDSRPMIPCKGIW